MTSDTVLLKDMLLRQFTFKFYLLSVNKYPIEKAITSWSQCTYYFCLQDLNGFNSISCALKGHKLPNYFLSSLPKPVKAFKAYLLKFRIENSLYFLYLLNTQMSNKGLLLSLVSVRDFDVFIQSVRNLTI